MAARAPRGRGSGAPGRAGAQAEQRPPTLTNAHIAELLALEAESAEGHLRRAFRRAGRLAFLWPEEAVSLLAGGRRLTELPGIGPHLARRLRAWIEDPPPIPEPPELRQGFLTLSEARRILEGEPDWRTFVRGDLQMHTSWSDGSGSVGEMADAAVTRGYDYIAATDHSRSLRIAGGMDEAELLEQELEIDRVNAGLAAGGARLRVLCSIELNLSPAGEGDMDPAALARLDLVLGSFHSALRRAEDQTPRYLAALRNPSIQVLGHPRGRIYDFRVGLRAEWLRVFEAAAELDKAMEVDAFPDRQDLDVGLLEVAREAGVRISLGTDAHQPWQLEFIDLALAAALRAGIPRERILNFMSLEELLEWVAAVRSRAEDGGGGGI